MVLLYSGEQHGVDILYFAQNLELMFPQSSCHSLLGTQWDWKWSLRSHLNLNSKLLDLVPSFSFLLHCLSLIVEGNRKCLILPAAFGCSQHRDSNTKFTEQEQELMACDCTKAAGFVVCSWWVSGHRGQSWGPDLIVSDALHTRIHNQILLQMQKKLKHQQKNRRRDLPNWPEFNFSVPKGANRKQNRINSPYLLNLEDISKLWRLPVCFSSSIFLVSTYQQWFHWLCFWYTGREFPVPLPVKKSSCMFVRSLQCKKMLDPTTVHHIPI